MDLGDLDLVTSRKAGTREQVGGEYGSLSAYAAEQDRFSETHREPPSIEEAGICSMTPNAQYCAHCPHPMH